MMKNEDEAIEKNFKTFTTDIVYKQTKKCEKYVDLGTGRVCQLELQDKRTANQAYQQDQALLGTMG